MPPTSGAVRCMLLGESVHSKDWVHVLGNLAPTNCVGQAHAPPRRAPAQFASRARRQPPIDIYNFCKGVQRAGHSCQAPA
mmetsp:Transcript_17433/g.49493  ORF Transcript_17433/g.49493 Transcript_17433/m.49493 type:complete len:80 (+) Transcript_17433:507-746(+)